MRAQETSSQCAHPLTHVSSPLRPAVCFLCRLAVLRAGVPVPVAVRLRNHAAPEQPAAWVLHPGATAGPAAAVSKQLAEWRGATAFCAAPRGAQRQLTEARILRAWQPGVLKAADFAGLESSTQRSSEQHAALSAANCAQIMSAFGAVWQTCWPLRVASAMQGSV